jgi:serine/threonine protein kinase
MFMMGEWIGDEKLAKRGTCVAVKAFCGSTEFLEYETETEAIGCDQESAAYTTVVYCKTAVGSGGAGDVAAVVSFLQEGTSKSIGRIDDDLRTMGRQMLEALMGLHAIRIIHRADIKPSNILWDDSRRRQAILIDFGRATEGTLEKLFPSDGRKFQRDRGLT